MATDLPRRLTKRNITRGFTTLLTLAALLYGSVVGGFYLGQEKVIFRPTTLPDTYQFNLPDTTEVNIPVDGATLSAIHFKQPDAKGLIFFLHGNGGNLSSWVKSVDFYRKNKFDLFMIDYRSFGKSTGTIEGEAQLHRDVMTAWRFIAPQYVDKKRVILGRSLGTTLAAKLASEVDVDWTVLISPFLNLDTMRAEIYPFLPAVLMRYTFNTNEWLPKINGPITIIHGDRDELISYAHAERLQSLVPKVRLVKIEGGSHNNLHHLPQYISMLSEQLEKL